MDERTGADSSRPATALIGIGNVLMGDDGFGPTLVRRFAGTWQAEPEIESIDAGTPGAALDGLIDGRERLVIVDALHDDGAPGEIRLLRNEELTGRAPPPRGSPHDPGLLESLQRLRLLSRHPRRVLLLGVVPACLEAGTELSSVVREALPGAELVLRIELMRLGHRILPRPVPQAPDLWWRRGPEPSRRSPRNEERGRA